MDSQHRRVILITKGLCSLWIVYYHLISAAQLVPFPKLNEKFFDVLWEHGQSWVTVLHSTFAAMSIHAVGIFIVLSGYGLTRSLLKKGDSSVIWGRWYQARATRLYPLYWYSHLIFLVFPFIMWFEPIDWRFLVSLTGIQVWPMDSIFFYANPSWWFIWLIIQLYAVYPFLFAMMKKWGRWNFLLAALVLGFVARYLVLMVFPSGNSGMMCMGGLFLCRLGEFAIGMFLAASLDSSRNDSSQKQLLAASGLDRLVGILPFALGCLIYVAGLYCYSSLFLYIFVDTISTFGFFVIVLNLAHVITRIPVVRTVGLFAGIVSFGVYLLHQPFALTLGEMLRGASAWEFYSCFVLFLVFIMAFAWASQELVDWTVKKLSSFRPVLIPILSNLRRKTPSME
ncbi:acyltransferase [Oscillatoria laete-virens NRMC-F 0139]|nr:acyltransferase [Oscillatoria laete-virens]MDL5054457.1 acyltransferase [Oscillatoria laete-virens NRMC-F 0139]